MLIILSVGTIASADNVSRIVAWGRNDYGQSDAPVGDEYVAIAGGYRHSLALKPDGSIVAWGSNIEGQCNVPSGDGFVAISAGCYHSLAIKSDGSLIGWGHNFYGQIDDIPTGNNFVEILGAEHHAVARKSDGSLTAWGKNTLGQCDVPTGDDYIAIAAGEYHSLALKSDGSLVAWGSDVAGQVSNRPTGNGFVDIAAGAAYNYALKSDGSLVAWGQNNWDQCNVPTGNGFVAIVSGHGHGLALIPGLRPVAFAGINQEAPDFDNDGSEQVTLDGSGSSDGDGAIISWEWEDDLGDTIPDGEITAASLSAGMHVITLTVTDDDGLADTDTVTITINNPGTLTVSSTLGGVVLAPGEGQFPYIDGTIAPILAVADSKYHFFGWTGTAVDFGKVADQREPNTIVTMDGDYTLEAAFTIIGDFTGDSRVNFKDFALFGDWWQLNDTLFDIAPPPDGDDVIDELDLALFSEHWLDLEYIRLYDMPLDTDPGSNRRPV